MKTLSIIVVALLILWPLSTPASAEQKTATFAGGCFWCMEAAFEKLDGVHSVTSGYTGGHKDNPTYEEVSAGGTGHLESFRLFTILPESATAGCLNFSGIISIPWRATASSAMPGNSTVPLFSTMTNSSAALPSPPGRRLKHPDGSSSPLQRKSCRPANSGRPRSTIRITTKRIPFVTTFIAGAADAISGWKKSGGRKQENRKIKPSVGK